MKSTRFILSALLALPALATAAPLSPSANTIDAVTVFLDRAEVTRLVDVVLPAGTHTIEVSGLPAQLIVPSLRVAGKGPQGLRIGSVETRRLFGEEAAQQRERELRAELQRLNDDKASLDGRSQALDTQAAFIERLAALPSESDKEGNRPFAPEKWPAAWQAIGKGMGETNAARVALRQELRTLQEKIRKVEEQLRQVQTGRRDTLSAQLHIEAASAGKARFTLSYQLPNATWSPAYDAQLTTEQGLVELTQAAEVRHASGEDWDNVTLTVSTARPSAGAVMPELHPWWLDFSRPPMPAKRLSQAKPQLHEEQVADEMLAGAMPSAPEPAMADAEEVVAQGEASEFSVRYRIPGRVSVPADNSRQRFTLAKQQFQATLGARTTPRLDPRAFLYAEFDYSGDTPLPAGLWQLQRDGVYVGKAAQGNLRPGEALALAFGPDEAITVEYQLVKDERGKQGLINREQRIERRYQITLHNGHRVTLPVSLFDQIPVARDEAIKVALLPGSSKPDEVDVEKRSGVLQWKRELKPGAKVELDFGYSVSFPLERQVPGF